MSTKNEKLSVPSLAQHFDAPDDYIGHFGWLCGYSADALFMNDAAERFTRATEDQRASIGRISLALMLDPGNSAISLLDAPSVAHLPFDSTNNPKMPFKLLHAKVALLGFRHWEHPDRWHLRLLVSTGNWTKQTLEESLDLAWRLDMTSGSLESPNKETLQNCADLKAIWQFFVWLQKYFNTEVLSIQNVNCIGETEQAVLSVKSWIDLCIKKAQGTPRFFDNRESSLLAQIASKVKAGSSVKRNYLAMGSGFYESSSKPEEPPKVPLKIVQMLRKADLLTDSAELAIYVNPKSCQAVATALSFLNDEGISVYPANTPTAVFGDKAQRALHAKFLFSSNYRESSNTCSSSWVYLGSGNLTHPGFANVMNANSGNLEAGVVFSPGSLYWDDVTKLLPIQRSEEIQGVQQLEVGTDMEQRDVVYIAPPITWLLWHEEKDLTELRSGDSDTANVEVLRSSGEVCPKTKTGFLWNDDRPREVCVRWQHDETTQEARIPIVDKHGRIAAAELTALSLEAAWWQLATFPMPADVDDEDEDEGSGGSSYKETDVNRKVKSSKPITSYPVRQMMELIENIAAKQIALNELDWNTWCVRLEQTLNQAKDSPLVQYFRENLQLNPLGPLLHAAFRPSFAESSDSEQGKLYEDVLKKVEESWQVNKLSTIGDMQ